MTDPAMFQLPSKTRIDKAGEALKASEQDPAELQILSSWRAAHAYALNTFQALFRSKIKTLKNSKEIVVAQRLKRLPSIVSKLKRFPTMNLSQMQDIGGIRIIVKKPEDVTRIYKLIQESDFRHKMLLPPKDYIAHPKTDGYRSLHQYFLYANKKHPELDGLRIELQIRTRLQHSWATAVETLGVLEHQAIKSGEGSDGYKQFFRVASALFSMEENMPVLSALEDHSREELVQEIRSLDKELAITPKLKGVAIATKHVDTPAKESYCFVMVLDSLNSRVSLTPFTENQLREAEDFYLSQEDKNRSNQYCSVVLISAGSLVQIRKAYPNYFLDTDLFLRSLSKCLDEKQG